MEDTPDQDSVKSLENKKKLILFCLADRVRVNDPHAPYARPAIRRRQLVAVAQGASQPPLRIVQLAQYLQPTTPTGETSKGGSLKYIK